MPRREELIHAVDNGRAAAAFLEHPALGRMLNDRIGQLENEILAAPPEQQLKTTILKGRRNALIDLNQTLTGLVSLGLDAAKTLDTPDTRHAKPGRLA